MIQVFEIDYPRFARAVIATRQRSGKTLREIAPALGMSPATFNRAEAACPLKAHHFLTLISWMNASVETFRK
jgi:hypothetical protein